jgi:SAM-dependent methyltransferase
MDRVHKKNLNTDQIITDLLSVGPIAWALIRVQEIYLLAGVPFARPVLDLACGDGSFAGILRKHQHLEPYEVGTDIDERELDKAKISGSYNEVVFADAAHLPFKDNSFKTIFSNGSVEHFSNFEVCLSEIHRVLNTDGVCYLTVPSNLIARYLFFSRLCRFLRLGVLADAYEYFFNTLFKHKNLYSHAQWKKILLRHKLILSDYFYYNFDPVVPGHDILLWFNAWNFIVKKITGNWFLSSDARKFTGFIERPVVQNLINVSSSKEAGPSLFLVIKK